MEPIHKDAGKVKAVEVLFFEEAELEKVKSNSTSFAGVGSLSVLYFKEYHRFVLQLNDWKYPLLRRLTIVASDNISPNNRSYVLPASNGFSYILRINNPSNKEAIHNFETILHKNSRFYVEGQEPPKHADISPDDKVKRRQLKDTGPKEVISEIVKGLIDKAKVTAKTHQIKTKNLLSTKEKVVLKDIKNKNFRKDAQSTFKKDFFETFGKDTQNFLQKRRENPNLDHEKGLEELHNTSESSAPTLFIEREDIEEAILTNKEMIAL